MANSNNMFVASAVVVWEWLNEHCRWRPYSPAVSHQIEAAIRSGDTRGGSVVLGQVESRLSPYIIDLQSLHQFRQDTGTIRPVRRSFYDPASALRQGWQWEWENDAGSWTPYDIEVAIAIENAHSRQQPSLDLTPLGFCYLIDFQNMTQVNRQSQRCRRIQRRSDMAYPLVSGPLPLLKVGTGGVEGGLTGALLGVGISGASMGTGGSVYSNGGIMTMGLGHPCSCQQCMLVFSGKTNTGGSGTGIQTLGRHSLTIQHLKTSTPTGSKPLDPPQSTTLGRGQAMKSNCSTYQMLPHGLAISKNTASPRRNAQLFAQSLAALTTGTSTLGISSSSRPPPPSLPPPQLPSSNMIDNPPSIPAKHSSSSAKESVPTATLITPASTVNTHPSPVSSSSPAVMKPQHAPLSASKVCHAPVPQRSSLAGLSRPALQRIAMAQSRALIASGVPTVPVKNLNGSSPVHPALAGITGILMSAAALPVCLTRPPKLVLHPPSVTKSEIKPVPGFGNCCKKTTKKQARKGKTPEDVVKKYLQKVKSPPHEDCTICMEPLAGPSGYKGPGVGPVSRAESVGRLAHCGHQYHFQCLVAMYNNGNKDGSLQCPTCKTIYGVKTGNQPAGKMEYHIIPHSLPGHPDCKTIRIIYNIPPGIQGPDHPNPGKPFTARGFPRHCYLPDSDKGRKVLRLLLVAWDRRLIFSVGTSSTTGESDTVIWNEVHHKTEFGSNLTGHGFPDPGHLDNVLEELRAQGITDDDGLTEK
ncbi:E3 ubiquitin-protein ligase DTX1-like isoform X2 [Syngnathoides biaculeatus]|uniref:E3 ubiquitin-protein ligase DTX1-like isoform X2 n=1 Tax=Syngnathoides biaculeatus TaxID=300417 RepID=UPI002ADDB863|nr:E3 ubiquitin-protein ligase DTX1-like isoform X2 [Syngnathoides biaculeatus]XP_061685686.1 E3 ubiquitin-protein ligase DTX1-like isoform X2 [Syngnathoides biaculeatus]XP_061685687.1 E3 ubiquitin-protein ligase DTX1-like isoform X2 [Syngnathoides biaculeatus]XP_061685688.1 E3 ubiquitin-protein ligase DTX1-like isoform X2 [Syngnathoides biaculeatus]XP_061685690.1 E3 ubiquitin-protein ligase DTX1-like isoform X2 [Syngnathoides biaculeatus]